MSTRYRVNFAYGTISGSFNNSQTTVTGTGFSSISIPAGQYLPIVINPGYLGVTPSSEITYVTNIGASSGGGNIITLGSGRGLEGTNAFAGNGTVWVAGPLVSDFGMSNMVNNGDVAGGSIPAGAVGYTTVSGISGNYTVASGDVNNLLQMTNTSAATVTLSGSFAVGQQITVYRTASGVTFSGSIVSTGATANAPKLRAQYSVATAVYLGSNNWLVTGDIV
jgi:hypothetical protein